MRLEKTVTRSKPELGHWTHKLSLEVIQPYLTHSISFRLRKSSLPQRGDRTKIGFAHPILSCPTQPWMYIYIFYYHFSKNISHSLLIFSRLPFSFYFVFIWLFIIIRVCLRCDEMLSLFEFLDFFFLVLFS